MNKNYIEITRSQTVRIPIIKGADIKECEFALKKGKIFDTEKCFDFDNEEIKEEDYSIKSTAKIYINGFIKTVNVSY